VARGAAARPFCGRLFDHELPVSGFAEITREILKYGADFEVVEPEELRGAVAKESRRMEKMYR